jgi:hypothetical protein
MVECAVDSSDHASANDGFGERPGRATPGFHIVAGSRVRPAPEVFVVGVEVLGRPGSQGGAFTRGEGDLELGRHLRGDLRLDGEDVREVGIEVLFPGQRRLGAGELDELGIDPNVVVARRPALPAYVADEEILHAELAGDVLL